MDREKLKLLLLDLIKKEVKRSVIQLTEEDIPRDVLENFDSLNEVNITTDLEILLNIKIKSVDIFYIKRIKLKFKDVIDEIFRMLNRKRG